MKYLLITGASSGIGYEMAKVFAKNGHNLLLVARRRNLLEKLKEEIVSNYPVEVEIFPFDLAIPNAGEILYEKLAGYTIEIMINNAGFGDSNNVWDVDLEKMNDMMHVNVNALAQLSLNYVKDYHDKEATLINVSSIGGYHTVPTVTSYCASKFYVSALTEGIARELQLNGKPMRAKVLAPGNTASEFFDNAYDIEDLHEKETLKSNQVFTPATVVAEHAYTLFQSDKVVGYVEANGSLSLKDPIFPHF